MFASRQEPNTRKWNLCIRRGRVIKGTYYETGKWQPIEFGSRAKADAVVQIFNEKYLETYDKFLNREGYLQRSNQHMPLETIISMMDVIREYCLPIAEVDKQPN
jgi:hypothetical protein